MQDIKDLPVAIVTGAAKGIGRALVDVLLTDGFIVVPVVRNQGDLREFHRLASDYSYLYAPGSDARVLPICCDITDESAEAKLAEFLEIRVGKVDILFNNAGYGATGFGIAGLDLQELDRVLAVHCHGPIRCVRAALPLLKKSTNPVIINVSSRFASVQDVVTETVPADAATYAYRIAKAAMNMFTACLAVELKSSGIRVLAVDPGKVNTRFGPTDADVQPLDAATAMVDLALRVTETGQFLHASGRKKRW